ncbi:MAG: phospholipase effector Tle1 domain-containing protein, partial [Mycobacterium sp.]
DTISEVWFRGAHCDVVGGPNAYWPLADITLDWMLDGAIKAGAIVCQEKLPDQPAPCSLDALAEGARSLRFRKVPEDALVHASVDVYVRAHPEYWRRLPSHFMWSDPEWAARAERLPMPDTAPAVTAEAASEELAAVAS